MSLNQETILNEDAFLVSETDSRGNIIFANEEFCRVAEYKLDDLMGKPHNIVRHKDMPRAAFEDLWSTVKRGEDWQGFVKNATKSDGYYWVFATIYPFTNEKGEQCYMSCRRKPSREDVEKYTQLYKTMA
ncbi:MAG: PAS domain-containing protein [Campylobacterota bacterium]|nr:PAS domain-containing protein [Campylobacterota bacterium]